jgi:hypothetical protein
VAECLERFQKQGRGALALECRIDGNDKVAVAFTANYVVQKDHAN